MGLWGTVDLVTTGAVTVRSPLAVTHFRDNALSSAAVTVYAELHNGSDGAVKGFISGTVAGARFEQPVELAANEDRTVVFTPELFPQLNLPNPKPWWPYQKGQPHSLFGIGHHHDGYGRKWSQNDRALRLRGAQLLVCRFRCGNHYAGGGVTLAVPLPATTVALLV